MLPPTNIKALADMIEQAIFEFDELATCAKEDLDDEMYDFAPEFRAMSRSLSALHHQVIGKVAFVDSRGLAFMRRAQQIRFVIPFFGLIQAIDEACRKGVSG